VGVGGADTARGIAFQHAQAVAACIEALESAEVAYVRFEGADDIVDFEVCAEGGRRLRVCQAKTRKEPYVWGPADIVATIKRWQELADAEDAQFEFLTDGSAGREIAEKLQPALRRARKRNLTDADRTYLASKGLDPGDDLLTRAAVESRQPDADALLDRVSLRVVRLLEMGLTDATTARSESLVNELFRLVSLRAGKTEPDERVITRAELSGLVGVALDVIDNTRGWDAEARRAYIEELGKEPTHPSLVILEAESISLQPDALTLVFREQAETPDQRVVMPATGVLTPDSGAVLSGAPGAGKSTTLELLVPEAIGRELCPVLVSAEGYDAGGLGRLVREALERRLGYRLAPAAIENCLNDDGATLLIDGAGELEAELRESLLFELQGFQRKHPGLRTIVTSRDPARLRVLGLASFVLQGLTPALRRTIAAQLLAQNAEPVVTDVEQRLGDVVDNPLLFVMALSLAKTGIQATTRAELFERFVEGMTARPGGEALSDVLFALLREACFALRARDVYSADRWTWRRLLADGLARLAEQRMFDGGSISADEALERARAGGLLRQLPSSGMLALTHDLFCDFLAAEAVRLGQHSLPQSLPESLEEAVVFIAQRGALGPTEATAVVTNPVAAARCAAAMPIGEAFDDEHATELLMALCKHLGPAPSAHLRELHIRAFEVSDELYVFALPASERPPGSPLDPDRAAAAARRVVKLAQGGSNLAAAVTIWLAEIRAALGARHAGVLLPVPTEREALPVALEAAFVERNRELERLCADICPALEERIRRALGFRGFHAVVLPRRTFTLPIAGGFEVAEHPLVFSFNADDISVRLADSVDRDFVEEPSTEAACENWLMDSPAQAALKDVKGLLFNLLPGLGP
jgi:hypothetical protein